MSEKLTFSQRRFADSILQLAGVDEGMLTDAVYDLVAERDKYFRRYVEVMDELRKLQEGGKP